MELKIKSRISEANIQAEFYHACKINNINCYLEYKINHVEYGGCRFDAVIYDENNIIYAIIEVKSYCTNKEPKIKTKQIAKYKQFEIPIFMLTRLEQIDSLIKTIKSIK